MARFRAWTLVPRIRVFGAPVYAHWSVLVAVAVLGLLGLNSPIYAGMAIACYLAVIFVHELGHAYVAHRLGYEVAAIRVAFLHGACEYEAPHTRWDEVLVAWGGVVAQLIVAAGVFVAAALVGNANPGYFGPVKAFLGYVNFLIALVNLAPGADLDGSIAWRIVPLMFHRYRARREVAKTVTRFVKRK
jgi:Zn-dependent protease